jgi:hypothetical protein
MLKVEPSPPSRRVTPRHQLNLSISADAATLLARYCVISPRTGKRLGLGRLVERLIYEHVARQEAREQSTGGTH